MSKEHKKPQSNSADYRNLTGQENKKKKSEKEIKDIEEEIVVEQESEIEQLAKKAQENLDGWQRCQADFENYKKRSAESQKDLIKYATQSIILEILPVIDNFHASTDHIPEEQKDNSWVTGIMYIQKQLENIVTENGVEEIEVKVGDNFDPIYHEAIEDHECVDCKVDHKYKNKIKKVLTKGYKIGEKVIRAARVVVE
ncbi:MAG: Protein GrpE [Candidatus Moranbacteria bacterium GW2011_GWD2_36_12]|nr:MAG: Protein GrpE [Candidatus Moranbacteria bacterium GW2011_GWD2_36_12]KKQ06526.1 MAG: Protein GrpE [Candidatus Moranbacteria bacterium GW2011_GWE2_36_40]